MHSTILSAALVAAVMNGAFAQTFTDCNPMDKTCPADPALGKTVTIDFTKGASDQFTLAEGTSLEYDPTNGAQFKMSTELQAPTISSNWYIMFGKVEVEMQASPGKGIVSSLVLESDDLDEIDLEWLGGDTTEVESNYFGKGNTTSYTRALYHKVSAPQSGMHTYTIDWDKDSIKWSIDGALTRTLAYADALGGQNYPQTPMRVKLGNWDGGSSTSPAGTVQWAGGLTDWSNGASYTMQVKSMTITDYTTTGSEYVWSDKSGSYESIKPQGPAGGGSGNTTETSSAAESHSSTVVVKSTSTGAGGSKTTLAVTSGGAVPTGPVAPLGNAPTAATTTAGGANPTGGASPSGSSTTPATPKATNGASGVKPSKYGAIDIAVVGLGLGLGYLVM